MPIHKKHDNYAPQIFGTAVSPLLTLIGVPGVASSMIALSVIQKAVSAKNQAISSTYIDWCSRCCFIHDSSFSNTEGCVSQESSYLLYLH